MISKIRNQAQTNLLHRSVIARKQKSTRICLRRQGRCEEPHGHRTKQPPSASSILLSIANLSRLITYLLASGSLVLSGKDLPSGYSIYWCICPHMDVDARNLIILADASNFLVHGFNWEPTKNVKSHSSRLLKL